MQNAANLRRAVVLALKLLVLAAVIWFVWQTAQDGWRELSTKGVRVSWPWLFASAGCYLAGLIPPVWFWRRTLRALHSQPGWVTILRAYFAGHLAKYVPGKALVLVVRAAVLREAKVPWHTAVVSVFLETLTVIAVGALLAAVTALAAWGWDSTRLAATAVVVLAAVVPTLPPVVRWVIKYLDRNNSAAESNSHETNELAGITWPLMATGWLAMLPCWLLFAASLAATLWACGAADVSLVHDWPQLLAAVAMSTVAGFISMLPGGLGARDGVLVYALKPWVGDATALAAALLLRLVWLFAELAMCGILYGVRAATSSRT